MHIPQGRHRLIEALVRWYCCSIWHKPFISGQHASNLVCLNCSSFDLSDEKNLSGAQMST